MRTTRDKIKERTIKIVYIQRFGGKHTHNREAAATRRVARTGTSTSASRPCSCARVRALAVAHSERVLALLKALLTKMADTNL